MADSAVLYTYSSCDTCRKAVKWLRAEGIDFHEKPIRETPPTLPELQRMLKFQEGNLKRLFNTAGRDYRAMGLAETFPDLSEREALALLANNGNLIKRPFFLAERVGLVGFEETAWNSVLG